MSLSKCCTEGVRHEGTPEGKIEQLGGVNVYVATPKGDHPKDKALLFLTDVWGLALPNNKLLADDFARNGFKTFVPDLFNGDHLEAGGDTKAFIAKHKENTYDYVEKVIQALHDQGIETLAGQGYCYGAKFVFHFASQTKLQVIAVPEDLEKLKASGVPVLINSCETDPQFPKESQAIADKIFADAGDKYKRAYFEGVSHGFSVRGDPKEPVVWKAKQGAFVNAVEWFGSKL